MEGKLQTRTWDDKTTGAKQYATEVLCDRFMILDGCPLGGGEGGYGGGARGGNARGGSNMGAGDDFDYAPPQSAGGASAVDDLPF